MLSVNLDDGLWAAGFIGHAVLLFILLRKQRARSFPVFTAWIAFMLARTALLFAVRHWAGRQAYANVFFSAIIPDYVLQLAVLYEICRRVLRPYRGTVPRFALFGLALLLAVCILGAFLITYFVHPTAVRNFYASILRLNLAFSLLRCGIFAAITIFADFLGLSWKHHVQRLAFGLAIYSIADVCADAVRAFALPSSGVLGWIDYVRIFGYLMALLVWNFSFFQNEPVRGTLSPEAEVFLGNLHRRLSIGRGA